MSAYDPKAEANGLVDNLPQFFLSGWKIPAKEYIESALREAYKAGIRAGVIKGYMMKREANAGVRLVLEAHNKACEVIERQRMASLAEKAKEPQPRKVEEE